MARKRKIMIMVVFVFLLLFAAAWAHFSGFYFDRRDLGEGRSMVFGASFRQLYAQYLGLDPKETALAIFDDLKTKQIRLIMPWNEVEAARPGLFDFSFFDWFVKEAEKRGVKLVINIGPRTAGWPEFHLPEWTLELSETERNNAALREIRKVVGRYRNSPAVEIWQIENEPFFNWKQLEDVEKIYGIKFKVPDREFLANEIKTVRSLSDKPIIITDSGELSDWREASKAGDYFGPTLYRFVWQRIYGKFGVRLYYGYRPLFGWISPSYYHNKAKDLGLDLGKVFISELQAEPWIRNESIINSTLESQVKVFGVGQFKGNIDFARRTGFPRAYLWGAEWWYYQKINGYPEIWNEAKKLWSR